MGQFMSGSGATMRFSILTCFLFLFVSELLASEKKSPRVGKLFWQSTASTTSTLSTTTQCFAVSHATNALVACGRKKRAVEPDVEAKVEISASKSINAANMDHLEGEEEVEPGVEAVPTRQARFVLYWRTTTSTSTSYTATSTLASISCTPSGFPLSKCG